MIYLDVFFIKNVFFNFLLIYIVGKIINVKINFLKILFASIFGGIYAIIALFSNIIFESNFLKIIIALIMINISFGKNKIIKNIPIFLSISYFISGIFSSFLKIEKSGFMFLIAIITIILLKKYNKEMKNIYEIKIILFGKEILLKAKLDTGNELKETVSKIPVIVVEEEKIEKEIEKELLDIMKNKKDNISDKYKNRIKIILFSTISNNDFKIGIKLDEIIIFKDKEEHHYPAIMILTNQKFKNYDSLIGENVFEGEDKYENNSFNKVKIKRNI